jgi:hypothetical protein
MGYQVTTPTFCQKVWTYLWTFYGLIYGLFMDFDPNFYVTYNRNFYTATTISFSIQVQNPVKQECDFTIP